MGGAGMTTREVLLRDTLGKMRNRAQDLIDAVGIVENCMNAFGEEEVKNLPFHLGDVEDAVNEALNPYIIGAEILCGIRDRKTGEVLEGTPYGST
jgi:hypothetical protein